MEQCLEEGKDYLNALTEKEKNKRIAKAARTKTMLRTVAEGKKMLAPRVAAGARHVPRPKTTKAKKAAGPLATRPAVPSLPALAPLPLPHSVSPYQKTLLKTSSRALPMPAVGFIDICFCLDTTGSMGG